VAVDNRVPENPVFFVTEDRLYPVLRRFVANGNGWGALASEGTTTFLRLLDGSRYEWTADEEAARANGHKYFPNSEGISYHDGKLYFMPKEQRRIIILDLDGNTYEVEYTG